MKIELNKKDDLINQIIEINQKTKQIINATGCEEAYDFITLPGGCKCTIHDELMRKNKEYSNLTEKWHNLHQKVYKYYKKLITNTFKKDGEQLTRDLFYDIQKYLKQNDEYYQAVGLVAFDLSSFTRNLITNI